MIDGLRPYQKYRESGIPWLKKVPEHWEIAPGLAAFSEKQEKNSGLKEKQVLSLSYGKIVLKPEEKLHGLVPESFESYQVVNPGDIIIRATDLQNDRTSLRVGLVGNRGIITSAYLCLRARGLMQSGYGYLQLHTFDLMKVFYGMGSGLRQNLEFADFKRLPVLTPPHSEQAAIIRFVDHAQAQIERLLHAKRKMIALLKEQKQVIINRAVTRGIGQSLQNKSSGVAWLEAIPNHWAVLPLKRWVATKITDGPHETPVLRDSGIDFMSAESMVDGHFDFSRRRGSISRNDHDRFCRKCRPQRDDIFMCKSGATTGKVAIVESDDEFSVWSPLALVRVKKGAVLPRFLFLVLQSGYVQRQVQDLWSYGTQPNLSMGDMARILVAMPPFKEQEAILKEIEKHLVAISAPISRAQREIELIREYRTRLVADVVTGQFDVREAADHLPDQRLGSVGAERVGEASETDHAEETNGDEN